MGSPLLAQGGSQRGPRAPGSGTNSGSRSHLRGWGRGGPRHRCSSLGFRLRDVAEGFSAQHRALPIGRAAIGRTSGRVERLTCPSEKSGDALDLGDHRQELHPAMALGACQSIDGKGSSQKICPRTVGAPGARGRGPLLELRGGSNFSDGLGRDARARRACPRIGRRWFHRSPVPARPGRSSSRHRLPGRTTEDFPEDPPHGAGQESCKSFRRPLPPESLLEWRQSDSKTRRECRPP